MSSDIAHPVSPIVAMFHNTGGTVAPVDVEPDVGVADELPRQEDAVFEDLIIGEHDSGDDFLMCKPCVEDEDDLLSSDLTVKKCTKPGCPDHSPKALPCPPEFTRAEWENTV